MKIRDFRQFQEWALQQNNIKNVLVRCDLNLPSDVEDLTRVYAIKDTIQSLLSMKLNVILISHYKRPKKEDAFDPKFSLSPIADKVSKVIEEPVDFIKDSVFNISREQITSRLTLLENLRFYEGETSNDSNFAKQLAKLADAYINEAFSVSHRAHASVEAVTKELPSFAGLSFGKEIDGISLVKSDIQKPYIAIIGGSKVSSKIDVLKSISQKADYLIIAGAMANTFLAAKGYNMGSSLIEQDFLETALSIAKSSNAKILLPSDFIVSDDINHNGIVCDISDIKSQMMCFDIGPKTVEEIKKIISTSKTLLWNGALGAFEFSNFDFSSKEISQFIADQTINYNLISVIGGGETVASIGKLKDNMHFVSTAGGAFLEYVSGYELPGVVALSQ